jgi:hypothetical protein
MKKKAILEKTRKVRILMIASKEGNIGKNKKGQDIDDSESVLSHSPCT